VDFICVHRCQSFVTAVAVRCGPTTSLMIGKRHGSLSREQPPRTSHLRADVGPCIAEWLYNGFASAIFKTRILHYLYISFVTQEFM
jgi:hypothetical protein